MNTSKTIWIKYPEDLKIKLHTLSFTAKNNETAFYVLGDKGEIEINYQADSDLDCYLVLMHTPNDYIAFNKRSIYSSMFTLNMNIPLNEDVKKIKVKKDNSNIEFYINDNIYPLSIKHKAFLDSTSFGFSIKGKGKIELTIF